MHFLVFGQLSEQLIQSHRIVAAGHQVIDGLLGAQLQTGAAVAGQQQRAVESELLAQQPEGAPSDEQDIGNEPQ
jgi:hypothetical protein